MTDSVIDIIGQNVERVNTILLPALVDLQRDITQVNYLYGPIKEVSELLDNWAKTGTGQKYPLVALIMPFTADKGKILKIDASYDDMRIIIAMFTEGTVTTAKRIENNFVPILRPIYNELMNQLCLDGRILQSQIETFEHKMIEWPFWDDGKDNNPFNDRLDIIEIKGLKLKIYTNNC